MTWLGRNKILCSNIEQPGCFNTGTAPAAVHKHYPLLHVRDVYLVGCVVDVRDRDVRIRAYNAVRDGRYIVKRTVTGHRVYAYRGAVSARKRYERLCGEAREERSEIANEIQALRKRAKDGDLEAMLTLGLGYGVT